LSSAMTWGAAGGRGKGGGWQEGGVEDKRGVDEGRVRGAESGAGGNMVKGKEGREAVQEVW
jgi:hypothetical protein